MEQSIQLFAAISFLVIGLSHVFQPHVWIVYFQALTAMGKPGVFLDGFLVLNFGAIVVAFHNVWAGPAVVLTLIGWSQVIKGLVRFVAPDASLRVLARMTIERAWQIRVSGFFALGLSGLFFWLRFRT